MSWLGFDDPWVLWLLPLALLPLLAPAGRRWTTAGSPSRRATAPPNCSAGRCARRRRWRWRRCCSRMAGPYRPEYSVERVGQGAEIVLLLDRSRSMDQGFAPGRAPPPGKANSPEALDYYFSQTPARLRESKGKVARQLLAEFTAQRPGRPLRADRLQHAADARARLHRRSTRSSRRPSQPATSAAACRRPTSAARSRSAHGAVRRPALQRLAHHHAGVRRRRPHGPGHARAAGAAGAQAARVDLLALPALRQQPGPDARRRRLGRGGRERAGDPAARLLQCAGDAVPRLRGRAIRARCSAPSTT